jgi:AraC-like DNA-binding protein
VLTGRHFNGFQTGRAQKTRETDLPINEVARKVGLPDPGYFARVFNRANGVPPRAWRKTSGRDQPDIVGAT